jgi:hypothetical protein
MLAVKVHEKRLKTRRSLEYSYVPTYSSGCLTEAGLSLTRMSAVRQGKHSALYVLIVSQRVRACSFHAYPTQANGSFVQSYSTRACTSVSAYSVIHSLARLRVWFVVHPSHRWFYGADSLVEY